LIDARGGIGLGTYGFQELLAITGFQRDFSVGDILEELVKLNQTAVGWLAHSGISGWARGGKLTRYEELKYIEVESCWRFGMKLIYAAFLSQALQGSSGDKMPILPGSIQPHFEVTDKYFDRIHSKKGNIL
jgi:hypothetical protein